MTVTISFYSDTTTSQTDIECCSIFSPLNELFCSLHVLLNPQGHGLMTSWAIDTKKKMTAKLLTELKYFSPLYNNNIPNFIMEEMLYGASDIESQLSYFGTTLLKKDVKVLIDEIKKIHYESQLVKDLENNENLVFLNLFSFLREYNENYFQYFYSNNKVLNNLQQEVTFQNDIIKQHGISGFICSINSNQFYWNDDEIKIQTEMNKVFYVNKGKKVYFIPSSVTWPHVRVNDSKDFIAITYNNNSRNIESFSSQAMADMFKVLSDPIRIEILINLKLGQKTPKNLSQILNISEPAVSHHLTLLKETGLVTKRREGKYVFYAPTNKVIRLIPNFYHNITK